MRELSAPHHDLAATQQWILMHILEKIPAHDAAHGFVPGRGTMTNATPHIGRASVINLDLKDFFPSITFLRVKGIFQELGYSPAVATILALLSTESPRRKVEYNGKVFHVATGLRALPQGACTSPAISNLLARRLDSRLKGIAQKLGFTYTRYADDLTFSGTKESAAKTGYLLARVRHIVADEKLTVNEDKTRVQRPNARQSVTGIVVNQRPNVPRHVRRRLRAILHHAKKEGLAKQNRQNHENFSGWLAGMIAYTQMVSPETGKRFRDALAALPQ
jgi:retron-type reverse transcriptase